MFQRFHAMKEQREGGFTLIELLVVILIIAILAAIAIPVFLNQRKKGWYAAVESAVKNAATAEESYATSHDGSYTTSLTDLNTEGLRYNASQITLSATVSTTGYCIKGEHTLDTAASDRWYHSADGRPVSVRPPDASYDPDCPA